LYFVQSDYGCLTSRHQQLKLSVSLCVFSCAAIHYAVTSPVGRLLGSVSGDWLC
jgi:hypothetical protein